MMTLLIIAAVAMLAYANGANDNFKGVATLFGSGTTGYGKALAWATVATFAGAVVGAALSGELLARFSGKGLVPESLTGEPIYAAAVALGAAATVLLATRLGLPVSTTHALVGAIAGAGLAAGHTIDGLTLATLFAAPLLVSPLLSLTATAVSSTLMRRVGCHFGLTGRECVCVGTPLEAEPSSVAAMQRSISVEVDDVERCRERWSDRIAALTLADTVDRLHYLSAGAVSFARGMNDAPKIAAPLLLVPLATRGNIAPAAIVLTAMAMAVGGIVSGRRVGETMSKKITPMTPGTGLAANLVTASIVLAASPLGLPVSTTHVSCGALFGLGVSSGQGRLAAITTILAAWITTLPLGAVCGGLVMFVLRDRAF
ncbi:MAG: inorganic phosphate transporter [Planctomycetaceae bacterium]|nr:inorganic phosphate transporter [Planctomycetaceae bacterium]